MLSFIESNQLIDCAVISEELGFNSVSVSDHIVLPETINSRYPDTADGKPFFNAKRHYWEHFANTVIHKA